MITRLTLLLTVLAVLVPVSFAAVSVDDVFAALAKNHEKVDSMRLTAKTTMNMSVAGAPAQQTMKQEMAMVFKKPNKTRVVSSVEAMGMAPQETVYVFDGEKAMQKGPDGTVQPVGVNAQMGRLPTEQWQIPAAMRDKCRVVSVKGDIATVEVAGMLGEGMQGMEQIPIEKTIVKVDMVKGIMTAMDAYASAGKKLMSTTFTYEKKSGVWMPKTMKMVMDMAQGGMSMKIVMDMEFTDVEVNIDIADDEFKLE